MIFTFLHSLKLLQHTIKKSNILRLLLVGGAFLITCSWLFFHFESKINPELTINDALWWGVVTSTTVGYGDYFAVTPEGRAISIVLMFVGVSIFGFITAGIASVFIENKLKEGAGLMDITFEGHTVIVGWNTKSQMILNELTCENPKNKFVIIDEVERLDLKQKNAFFVHGEATRDEVLKRANIEKASNAIIVGDQNLANEGMIDAKTVLICLAIDKLNPNLHLIAEVLNEENTSHFERANVNDIIVSSHMSSCMIVRSAISKNVSSAMKELMTNTYGNEIYERIVKSDEVGITFKQLVEKYLIEHDSIVIGLVDQKVMLNPSKNHVIDENMSVIYMAHNAIR